MLLQAACDAWLCTANRFLGDASCFACFIVAPAASFLAVHSPPSVDCALGRLAPAVCVDAPWHCPSLLMAHAAQDKFRMRQLKLRLAGYVFTFGN